MISPGDTFFGQLLEVDPPWHLWIVASAPAADGRVAVVNLSTHFPGRQWHSDSCKIFMAGDHPFLNRDSCIAAPYADKMAPSDIETKVEAGSVEPRELLKPGVLRRVQDAVLASPDVSEDVKVTILDTLGQAQ